MMDESPEKQSPPHTPIRARSRIHLPAINESPLYLLRLFLLLVFTVIVQTTLSPYVTVLGAKPDVALIMVVSLAMMRGPVWGASVGFAMGLLLDIALVQTMGVSSLLYTLAGYFGGLYGENIDPDAWLPPLVTVFVVTLAEQFLMALFMFLLGVEASVQFVLIKVMLPVAVLNALLAPPVFMVSRRWLGGEQKKRAFSFKR
jgi:rod shape-determining protein MreD